MLGMRCKDRQRCSKGSTQHGVPHKAGEARWITWGGKCCDMARKSFSIQLGSIYSYVSWHFSATLPAYLHSLAV